MRIGIVSDSHGNLHMLEMAIDKMLPLDFIIHLGDGYKDIVKVNEKYKLPIEYVSGNNDFLLEKVPEKLIKINGRNIFLTHGNRYNVYFGIESLYFKALEMNADLVLYGHTHIQEITRNKDIIFLNPGSVSRPRDGRAGCAVAVIDDKGNMDFNLLRLDY